MWDWWLNSILEFAVVLIWNPAARRKGIVCGFKRPGDSVPDPCSSCVQVPAFR